MREVYARGRVSVVVLGDGSDIRAGLGIRQFAELGPSVAVQSGDHGPPYILSVENAPSSVEGGPGAVNGRAQWEDHSVGPETMVTALPTSEIPRSLTPPRG